MAIGGIDVLKDVDFGVFDILKGTHLAEL